MMIATISKQAGRRFGSMRGTTLSLGRMLIVLDTTATAALAAVYGAHRYLVPAHRRAFSVPPHTRTFTVPKRKRTS